MKEQIDELQIDLMTSIVRSDDSGEIRLGDTAQNLYKKGWRKQREDEEKDPEPSAATNKRQPAPKCRDLSDLPAPLPLGYKLQDGRLVEDEAEAKLLQRAVNEIEKLGKVSEAASRALAEAEQAKREAWEKAHPKTE